MSLTNAPDPELDALPTPQRRGRTLALAVMLATGLVSLVLVWELRGEIVYSMVGGRPERLGALEQLVPRAEQSNSWVQADGSLEAAGAIRYSRPLESGSHRLAAVRGNPRLWVEIRVPEGMEGPHFIPPTSFVGRLVPASRLGVRHVGLVEAVGETGQGTVPEDAWLLVDGEMPRSTRWVLGVLLLCLAFAVFNLWGLARLLKPLKSSELPRAAPSRH